MFLFSYFIAYYTHCFLVHFFVQKIKSLIWRKESLRNILASGNLFQLSNWNPTLIHHLIERYLIPLPPYFTVGLWWFQNWDHPNVQTEDQKTNHFTLMCGLGKKGSYISSFSTLFSQFFLIEMKEILSKSEIYTWNYYVLSTR